MEEVSVEGDVATRCVRATAESGTAAASVVSAVRPVLIVDRSRDGHEVLMSLCLHRDTERRPKLVGNAFVVLGKAHEGAVALGHTSGSTEGLIAEGIAE